jgi:hypothetical protein
LIKIRFYLYLFWWAFTASWQREETYSRIAREAVDRNISVVGFWLTAHLGLAAFTFTGILFVFAWCHLLAWSIGWLFSFVG